MDLERFWTRWIGEDGEQDGLGKVVDKMNLERFWTRWIGEGSGQDRLGKVVNENMGGGAVDDGQDGLWKVVNEMDGGWGGTCWIRWMGVDGGQDGLGGGGRRWTRWIWGWWVDGNKMY